MKPEEREEFEQLKRDFARLNEEFYRDNFPESKVEKKRMYFTETVTLPIYDTMPAQCQIGEVGIRRSDGKLQVCETTNNWVTK